MTLEVWDATRDVRNLFITPEIRSRIMRFEPHQISAGHTHDVGHEMFVVLDGQAEFTIDGETGVVGPGQACVARAGQWHEVRAVGDGPMTLYLSVTPHVEPTHTHWDREGGNRLPYRYGAATRAERGPLGAPETLLEQHVAACGALAEAARMNAQAQSDASRQLNEALARGDKAGTRRALDEMWSAYRAVHDALHQSELTWNDLAAAAGED
ncbi:MAG: cupin domain-containing protein [Chloroflexi bacterium]|nr:cupin domain-containing protein [Chloroflexota bacterium]